MEELSVYEESLVNVEDDHNNLADELGGHPLVELLESEGVEFPILLQFEHLEDVLFDVDINNDPLIHYQ